MVGWIESDLVRLIIAIVGSVFISLLAYRFQALSITGALSAIVVGTSLVFFGEPIWFALLLTFFISSTFWSKFKRFTTAKINAEKQYEKSGQRDWMQVTANGGLATILCVLAYYVQEIWLLPMFIMILAIVNADTWATEIGSLSRQKPRHIVTGQYVEAGTSGGITLLGTLAALSGAALIGFVAVAFSGQWNYLILATTAGIVGCIIDSILGATVQRMFRCTSCHKLTERKQHCERDTIKVSGFMWINNDVVNITSSIIGSVAIWIMYNAMV